jgi:S-DNA-T family DNA segregation ATPase FtsK/SpoIIIE
MENQERVLFKNIINKVNYPSKVSFPLGADEQNNIVMCDLNDDDTSHLLVSGAVGQGKSTLLKTIILTLIQKNTPSEVKLTLVDPKQEELGEFSGISHVEDVISNSDDLISLLKDTINEKDRRLELLKGNNIEKYNQTSRILPYIVIVFDEYSNFMEDEVRQSEIDQLLLSLMSNAKDAGIHLIMATDKPEVTVITGIIKSVIPAKIAFRTNMNIDSRVIISSGDAFDLKRIGLALLVTEEGKKRVLTPYIAEEEMNEILNSVNH